MVGDPNWFQKKWGLPDKSLEQRISNLEKVILDLQEKYQGALNDIKKLEDENIETTNTLYEIMNSIDAVDARIDIVTLEKWNNKDV